MKGWVASSGPRLVFANDARPARNACRNQSRSGVDLHQRRLKKARGRARPICVSHFALHMMRRRLQKWDGIHGIAEKWRQRCVVHCSGQPKQALGADVWIKILRRAFNFIDQRCETIVTVMQRQLLSLMFPQVVPKTNVGSQSLLLQN